MVTEERGKAKEHSIPKEGCGCKSRTRNYLLPPLLPQWERGRGRGTLLHRRIELLLLVLRAEAFPMESSEALRAPVRAALEDRTGAEELNETGFLHLLFEAVLQGIVRFRCFLHGVDGHRRRL